MLLPVDVLMLIRGTRSGSRKIIIAANSSLRDNGFCSINLEFVAIYLYLSRKFYCSMDLGNYVWFAHSFDIAFRTCRPSSVMMAFIILSRHSTCRLLTYYIKKISMSNTWFLLENPKIANRAGWLRPLYCEGKCLRDLFGLRSQSKLSQAETLEKVTWLKICPEVIVILNCSKLNRELASKRKNWICYSPAGWMGQKCLWR